MKKSALLLLGLTMLIFVRWHPTAQENRSFLVVAHADNPVTSLTRTQVSRMLLKKTSRWDDGSPAEPVDQTRQNEVRELFTKEIHGRSVSSIKSFWQRQIFSGRGVPPPELENDAQVLDFVKSRPGAIGYITAGVVPEGVKVLTVTE